MYTRVFFPANHLIGWKRWSEKDLHRKYKTRGIMSLEMLEDLCIIDTKW